MEIKHIRYYVDKNWNIKYSSMYLYNKNALAIQHYVGNIILNRVNYTNIEFKILLKDVGI